MKKTKATVLRVLWLAAMWLIGFIIVVPLLAILWPVNEAGEIKLVGVFLLLLIAFPTAFSVWTSSRIMKNIRLKRFAKAQKNSFSIHSNATPQDHDIQTDVLPVVKQEIDALINSIDEALGEKYDDIYQNDIDPLFYSAAQLIFETKQASVSMLQRRLAIGYSRAARLVDTLEKFGVISEFLGSTPRQILVTPQEFESIYRQYINVLRANLEINSELEPPAPSGPAFDDIDNMSGSEFEEWCAELLRNNGFENVAISARSGDQGVDILAERSDITYAIQCKCYSHDLGNTPVQEVLTGKTVYHRHIAAVMTNRHFTKGAKEAASATGVLLWDRDKLKTMYDNANKQK